MMCAMMGWLVDTAPLAIMRNSRSRSAMDLHPRRSRNPLSDIRIYTI